MIQIGTSGFSYKDWEKVFYPSKTAPGGYLTYYSKFFSTVEINSTYYRLPTQSFFVELMKKTPQNFIFSVKVFQGITHERNVSNLEQQNSFKNALIPLKKNDKLGALLFQFPFSFKPATESFIYLEKLLNNFHDFDCVIEFRHSAWWNDETFSFLRQNNAGLCCVDLPRLQGLLPADCIATSKIGYIRFHGRNVSKWWKHDHAWERYNYLYSREELLEWVPGIRELEKTCSVIYVYANNHYMGQAIQNAWMLKTLLNLHSPGEPTKFPFSPQGTLF